MKIAIVGAMCVGKTTLVNDLKQHTSFPILPEVALQMIREGYKLYQNVTVETEYEILRRQVKLEEKYDEFIADRCLVDLLAYANILFEYEDELLLSITAELMKAKYDVILFIEPEFPMIKRGKRSADPAFQKEINNEIKKILKNGKFHHYKITGSKEDRVKQVLKIIKKEQKDNKNSNK